MGLRARPLLVMFAFLVCASARAEGSFEPVYINRISIVNGVEYELVVTPLKVRGRDGYADPYMGQCTTFTVQGTYARRARLPAFVTRDGHVAALAHLKQAQAADRWVNLGWMGTGFVPADSGAPCTFRSRALHLHVEQGTEAVISYYEPL
jgi:hypothetical protein